MKALFYGIAISAAAGLLTGGFMRYSERPWDEIPEGPQILVSGPSARNADPGGYGGAVLTGYSGEVPEYVVGTDWLQPAVYEVAYDEPAYEPVVYEHPIREAATETPVQAPAPEMTRTVYPSVDGNVLAGLGGGYVPEPLADARHGADPMDAMNARIAADGEIAADRIANRSS